MRGKISLTASESPMHSASVELRAMSWSNREACPITTPANKMMKPKRERLRPPGIIDPMREWRIARCRDGHAVAAAAGRVRELEQPLLIRVNRPVLLLVRDAGRRRTLTPDSNRRSRDRSR